MTEKNPPHTAASTETPHVRDAHRCLFAELFPKYFNMRYKGNKQQLSKDSGVSVTTIYSLTRKRVGCPTSEVVHGLVTALGFESTEAFIEAAQTLKSQETGRF